LLLSFLIATLVAFGLTPTADAAITCGKNVRRSITLTADLNCTGDGLVVRASGITINLGGYTITGDGGVGDFGIDNTRGKDNVVVKNGTVQGFDDGVRMGQDSTAGVPTGNVVRNVIASNNTFNGIDLDEGSGHKVVGSRTENNGDSGIDLNANRSVVSGSVAEDNGDEGIHVTGSRNSILGSRTDNNDEDGIDVEGNGNIIKGSSGTENASDGVDIAGDNTKIVSSNFSTNDGNGVFVESGSGTKVKQSTLSTNGLPIADDDVGLGFDGQAGSNATGEDVTANGNDNPAECIPDICL
jgi:hypothetical protein